MLVVPAIAAILLLGACGRIGFDPHGIDDATGGEGASGGDGANGDTGSSGLLLSFQFEADGLVRDHAGGPDATCTACPTSVPGVRTGTTAARFSGSQCLLITSGNRTPPVITFALWTKQPTLQTATMFGKPRNGASQTGNSLEVYTLSTGSSIYVVAGNSTVQMTSALGAWHHVAVVFDGSTLTGYIDGVVDNMKTGLTPTIYAGDPFRIGCDQNTGVEENYFTGDLDEVRIYDRALSAVEIKALATP